MTEEDARLSLLVTELNTVQAAIRALDTIDFQIKGWSVTASLAIGGYAIAYHRLALIIVGIGSLQGFLAQLPVQIYTAQFYKPQLSKLILH
jgi:hypothetical protein